MSELPSQAQDQFLQRLRATAPERDSTRSKLATNSLISADTPERLEKRKNRLLAHRSMATALPDTHRDMLLSGAVLATAPAEVKNAFEVLIEGRDIQQAWFLPRGAELRRTVGRVHIRNASYREGWGTGFLVAPNLLLTNQHVLESADVARHSWVEFEHEETYSGQMLRSAIFDLCPDVVYLSSPADDGLDYALVAVASQPRQAESNWPQATLAGFGFNQLSSEEGKLVKGEPIHIIHHPEGQARQLSLRNNRLMALADAQLAGSWMHYETDTLHGSSGGPLFNNQWEVVGIHHAGAVKKDEQGRPLAIGGALWTSDMGESRKWYYANEGLRISRFMQDVVQRLKTFTASTPDFTLTGQGQSLVEAMFKPTAGPAAGRVDPPTAPPPPTDPPRRFRPE
ncbi:serine protease [Hymenobacter gummosus]|uniref:Serine protease n=1 Tax=Hymenobacter gummosus TaxID=1776032 RepID=A0A431U657_9BACT|nr:serine protease [Hymenobacter gummosus]RTQ52096.1 serine protease [Hymenobacter gummosus]